MSVWDRKRTKSLTIFQQYQLIKGYRFFWEIRQITLVFLFSIENGSVKALIDLRIDKNHSVNLMDDQHQLLSKYIESKPKSEIELLHSKDSQNLQSLYHV